MSYALIFLYSFLIDVGAVLYTRSVQGKNIVLGMFVTGTLAALNWASIWTVMKQNDQALMAASVVGHVAGFAFGMLLPLRDASQKERPTTER